MNDDADRPAQTVHAGQVTAALDGLSLRGITYRNVPLGAALRPNIRDSAWMTVAPTWSDETRCEIDTDGFLLEHTTRHESANGIDFSWAGSIRGTEEGVIEATMHGVAQTDFTYGRIGLEVLHPLSFIGREYVARIADGSKVSGVFPADIAPQPLVNGIFYGMFDPFRELRVEIAPGLSLVMAFDGDIAEMEDHRNWTDAGFKTYFVPLARGLSPKAERGEQFFRRVRMWPVDGRSAAQRRRIVGTRASAAPPVSDPVRTPALGVQLTGTESDADIRAIRDLSLDHLRIDLDATEGELPHQMAAFAAPLDAIDVPTEVALTVGQAVPDLSLLQGFRLARVLVLAAGQLVTPREHVNTVRAALRAKGIDAAVGGGTDFYFAELNQIRPDVSAMDFVAFSITPQVHTFDDASVLETTAIQTDVVRAARGFCSDRPITISPVTLRMRAGVPSEFGGALAPDVDKRQGTVFCAAWTLASLVNLARSAADSVTYFETVGPRGLLNSGRATPTFVLLRDLALARGKTQTRLVGAGAAGTTALLTDGPAGAVTAWVTNTAATPTTLVADWATKAWRLTDSQHDGWQELDLAELAAISPGSVMRLHGSGG